MATLAERITDLATAIKNKINLMVPRLLPAGGNTGDVLAKNSAEDNDVVWAAPAGGSNAIVEQADITVSPAKYGVMFATISKSGVLTTSNIQAWLVPNSDFDRDDLIGHTLYADPSIDSINLTLAYDGPMVGTYTIHYTVS